MEYAHLGRTGLRVSRICLGSMNFGPATPEPDAVAIMDRALEAGVNFFDTANIYGRKVRVGLSEEIIGRWFAHDTGRRERIILTSKVYGRMSDWPNDGGLSARHIIAACEASLRRLGTEWIDLYQMHHISRTTPWEEIWQAMETLVLQGKVRYVGSSNFAGWHLAAAQAAAASRHFLGLVSEQCLYNLLTRHVELEVIPAAMAYGIAVLPWSPLHGGLLAGASGKLRSGAAVRTAEGRAAKGLSERRDVIERYEALCGELGHEPADVAVAWLLPRPGVTAPVLGPRTAAQFESSVRAVDLHLDDDTLAKLDLLFPPIGNGPAPEAWTW